MEAVLKGAPITPIASEAAASTQGPPLKAYDIRHVSKDENSAASNDPQKVKTRCRFKRTGTAVVKPKARKAGFGSTGQDTASPKWAGYCADVAELNRSTSHESSVSHQSEAVNVVDGESKETESMISVETAEPAAASLFFRAEPETATTKVKESIRENDLALDLTLGLEPTVHARHVVPMKKRRLEAAGCGSGRDGACKVELGLEYSA